MEVSAYALEEFVGKNGYVYIEVTCGDAGITSLTLTRKADARAIVNAWRNIDRQRALTPQGARTHAGRTLNLNNLTMTVAGRTGSLETEQTLCKPYTPGSSTFLTGLRARARLGTGAGARVAGYGCR